MKRTSWTNVIVVGLLFALMFAPRSSTQEKSAATFPTQPYDAYLWRKGYATDLGHLDGDCFSEAWALNLHSQVVGDSFGCGAVFQHHAFLWENSSLVDLNSLIPPGSSLELVFATSINERGEIAGNGVPPGVSPGDVFDLGHAFVLLPCDENHPDIEDCDYSLVETTAQPTPQPSSDNASRHILPAALWRANNRSRSSPIVPFWRN